MRCFAHSYAKDLKISNLHKHLSEKYQLQAFDKVLHLKVIEDDIPLDEGDVFIFPFGAFVCWGLTEKFEQKIRKILSRFTDSTLGAEGDDLCTYGYSKEANIDDDHITLPNKYILTKLAISYGLAQSVKLGGFEVTVDKITKTTKKLPENLSKDGNIHLSRKQIRKLMGKIFIDRHSINLHLKLLDVPNIFWDKVELEPLYEMVTEYMQQSERVMELNRQLEVMHELLEMLGNELNHQHSSKLEWIIIILIFVEIVLTLTKDFFKVTLI